MSDSSQIAVVPLASLISATKPPVTTQGAILSPDGLKRYFVVHGGLFSKDGVTLDEIRKIERVGRQPGQEGLMCTFFFFLLLLPLGANTSSDNLFLQAR